jgi:hypothetical protein
MLNVLYVPIMESEEGQLFDNWFTSYDIRSLFQYYQDLKKEGFYFERFYIYSIFSDEEVGKMQLIWEKEKVLNGKKIYYSLYWDGRQYIIHYWLDQYNHFALYAFSRRQVPSTVALGFRYIRQTWF